MLSTMDLNALAYMTVPDGYTAVQFTRMLSVVSSISQFFSSSDKNSPISQVSNSDLSNAEQPYSSFTEKLGVALFTCSVGQIGPHNFGQSVNAGAAQDWIKSQIGNSSWLASGHAVYDLFFPYVCQYSNGVTFSQYQSNNPTSWAKQIADHITSNQFYNVEIAGKITNPIDLTNYLNLYLYKLSKLDNSQVANVMGQWKNQPEIAKLPNLNNFGAVDVLNRTDGKYWDGGLFSSQAVSASQTDRQVNGTYTMGCQGGPGAHCSTGTYVSDDYYGEGLANWIHGSAASQGWYTGKGPDNHDSHSPPSVFGSCVAPRTRISLAKGAHKAVSEIRAGDVVLSIDEHGKVVEDTVHFVYVRPRHYRLLYGFNGAEPFFTDEHAFLNEHRKFVAVVPDHSLEENPSVEVSELKEGAKLLSLHKDNHSLGSVLVEKLASAEPMQDEDEFPVYNLVLHKHHIYFAEGLAMFDMVPDFSKFPNLSYVAYNLWKLSAHELDAFTSEKDFQHILTLLTNVVDAHLSGKKAATTPTALGWFREKLGANRAHGFAPDARVRTADGRDVPIKEIHSGDVINTGTTTAKVLFAIKQEAPAHTPLRSLGKSRPFFSEGVRFVHPQHLTALAAVQGPQENAKELYSLVLDKEHTHFANGELVFDSFPDFSQHPQAAVILSQWWGKNAPKMERHATPEELQDLIDHLTLTIHYSVPSRSAW